MSIPASALLALFASAAVASDAADAAPGRACAVTRILADGREIRSGGPVSGVAATASRGRAAASAFSRGSSSVSVSSSSSARSGRGGNSAYASSSTRDEHGRLVTRTDDGRSCTIVIDERGMQGEE